ncbi:MAG: hypothetical protein LN415_02050 [Candidatus Thermoplasmatota archaeon]|nr:hypothetical protein [Candidatus Thermoplasmatota archaeon]
MIPKKPQGEIPQPPDRRKLPTTGEPPSPLWADMKDEFDNMKKAIAELRKRMEGLEGRISTLEETGK